MTRRAFADERQARSFRVEHVTYRVGERTILNNVSLELTGGELVAIVGRNGAGKSTLLHLMTGLLPANEGAITLDGEPLRHLNRKDIARRIALLPQQARMTFGFPVHDIVLAWWTPKLWLSSCDETRRFSAWLSHESWPGT